MKSEGSSRCGASERTRLRPPFRLTLGSIAFDLMPDGWVRVAGNAQEFCDLRSFLADVRGARREQFNTSVRSSKGGT